MKRTLITLTLVTGLIYNSEAQVRFAPEAGVNLNMGKYDPNPGSSGTSIGFKVGAIVDLGITDHFSVQPGVFYSLKGAKNSFLGIDMTTNLSYIDIPVMAIYKFDAGPGKLFVGLGPNVGIGVSAKAKAAGTSVDLEFGSDSEKIKRIDFGGNVNVGYELNMGLYLRVGYNMGFVNLSNDATSYKNMGLGISVGYFFGKKD